MGLREPDYISHELRQCRSILCSSEEYIRIHGRLRHPKDLLNHELIGHLQMPTMVRFTHNIEEVEIPFAGRFNYNSASVLLDAVRANLGIAILPDLALLTDLNQGQLVELLPDWQCPSVQIDAMTDHRYLSRCVKTFLNFVKMDSNQNKVRRHH